ncbi:hypothetical protein PybrP1_005431 [[Pythium] brassicae (nom. inval.)]|nr:hypothetical protein PybrP1_005431 [[Pythium] brassicae (nom. inval.)]
MLAADRASRFHEHLLSERTRIRNSKSTLQWMKRCWKLALRTFSASTAPPAASSAASSSPLSAQMSAAAYNELYAALLGEMTICRDHELSDAVLRRMRQRDMAAFPYLNFDRFCCSLFFFVEMWVEEVTADEYERIFRHIHRVLSGEAPTMSLTHPTTLASFNAALDSIIDLEASSVSIGKSIGFDAKKYVLQFGDDTLSIPIPQFAALAADPGSRVGSGDRVGGARATAPALPTAPAQNWSAITPTRRRRTIDSVPLRSPLCLPAPSVSNLSMARPKTPTFMKRYHDATHGDRLYKFMFVGGASSGTLALRLMAGAAATVSMAAGTTATAPTSPEPPLPLPHVDQMPSMASTVTPLAKPSTRDGDNGRSLASSQESTATRLRTATITRTGTRAACAARTSSQRQSSNARRSCSHRAVASPHSGSSRPSRARFTRKLRVAAAPRTDCTWTTT